MSCAARHHDTVTTVARHRTAMSRSFLSRPMQQAHDDGLLDPGTPIFDYGCGRGDDVRTLRNLGFTANGWDPAYAADEARVKAAVVNIGYVVNVIEYPTARCRSPEGMDPHH